MFRNLGLGLGILGLALAAGCNSPRGNLADRKINVVTTTGMITDIVQQVGGERVDVHGLMGPGVDPHLYKASYGDHRSMEDADVIFYNGLHLEGHMVELFEKMAEKVTTLAVTRTLDPKKDLRAAPEGYEGTYDPHVWFDVTLWMKAVECVRDTLIDLDPGSKKLYRANAKAYLAELEKLHKYVREQAKKVPPKQRVLITAHDAFYYFGHRYGFQVEGLQGVSTAASDADVHSINKLADRIVRDRIPALFVESSVNHKTMRAVQAAVRKKGDGFEVAIGGELFSDALGNPGTPEGTYIGMVKHNIDTIVKALAPK